LETKLHTPYDGSSKPFTIALQPLNLDEWIEVDDRLAEYLGEKDTRLCGSPGDVLMAEADTLAAQREVLDLLLDYLPRRFPEHYRCEHGGIEVLSLGVSYVIGDFAYCPLELASRLVQEDLVLLRPGSDGHRIVAACVCFPSEWSLREKFGKVLADVHGPVPGIGRGTRTAQMIERIFANLQPANPVERFNWFLLRNPALYLPELEYTKGGLFDDDNNPTIWLRVERQTLRRLPASGDLLFTIRICIDPFEKLSHHPDAARLASGMRQQIMEFDTDQSAYKGLETEGEAVIAELERIIQDAAL
jgi:hypothetical protein